MVKSPCVNWCEMHPQTGYCLGCFRTLDEIARWSSLSDDEQRAINLQLPLRKTPKSDSPSLSALP
ncbi:MAG: DUF1289 domain-containing protein [Polynucleobacter sp.]